MYDRVNPALLKDPRYEYQGEVRALWRPHRLPIEPKLIMCPSLARFCSVIGENDILA
jgi:peptide-methionine (R)-S-oxide reductase